MPDLHRTNINLHASDVAYFQHRYGHGWTEKVRDIVHDWVRSNNAVSAHIDPSYTKPQKSNFSELDQLIKEQPDD